MKSELSVFTVCNVAYLNKTLALAQSVYDNMHLPVHIFVIDKKRSLKAFSGDSFIIHWIEELGIPDFIRLSFKYDIIELSTSVKPYIAKYLLKESSKVVFFDPDVMVFSDLNGIVNELDKSPVLVTPHYLYPKKKGDINDWRLMRFGFHNLGFFAVNDSDDSVRFLDWWGDRCFDECFTDSQFGVFTDQKWINIAIGFFPFIKSTFNIGYNVAYWNLDQRTIVEKNGKYYMNDGSPLVFVHFSAFNYANPQKWSRLDYEIGDNSFEVLSKLSLTYDKLLKDLGREIEDKTYAYDYFDNGIYITPVLRKAFASVMEKFEGGINPFDSTGRVYEFARKNKLLSKKNQKYKSLGYNNLSENGVQRKMKLMFFIMRCILRITGPNTFMNVSRLFVYLSYYQKLPKMWKL